MTFLLYTPFAEEGPNKTLSENAKGFVLLEIPVERPVNSGHYKSGAFAELLTTTSSAEELFFLCLLYLDYTYKDVYS